ncbi:MAG: winged helix-turn-helix transcriptional regulator [Candidatus Cloacimonetes bacterium]|nr:winged helix-turn-helix transcriptional regulator [Candidatus Cloacimonadota bacterium]
MREFNGTEPEFETSEDFLKTTLYNNGAINDPNEPNIIQNDPNLDPNEPNLDPNLSLKEQILAILQRNPQATYNEMAQLSGKSMASIKRALAMLKKQGYIHRQGSTRSGSWQLLQGVSLEQSNKSSY